MTLSLDASGITNQSKKWACKYGQEVNAHITERLNRFWAIGHPSVEWSGGRMGGGGREGGRGGGRGHGGRARAWVGERPANGGGRRRALRAEGGRSHGCSRARRE
ncbi:hypothetical protein R5R35_009347 [Gryllus longicercus]|uniref:Uncharacterized protein n=1 Tax=Gryllus longicercus TaxID=2509291 RepID=A0AAN9VQM4_9ORTH